MYQARNAFNKTVWLTQEKQLNIFQHEIEAVEQFIAEDHSNEKSPVLSYNSGLYYLTFIKARNE